MKNLCKNMEGGNLKLAGDNGSREREAEMAWKGATFQRSSWLSGF